MKTLPPAWRAPAPAARRSATPQRLAQGLTPSKRAPADPARPAAKPSPAFGGVGNWRLGSSAIAVAERNAPDWRLPLRLRRVAVDRNLESAAAADRLWFEMRARRVGGLSFRRQHRLGRYVAGFLSKAARLIVDVEGEQPSDGPLQEARRAAYLEKKGFTLLRFTSRDVSQNMGGVLEAIIAASAEGAGDNR